MAASARPGTLLVRAHAGPGVGAGHVMRCLALAQAWKARGGSARFLLGPESGPLQGRLRAEGFDVDVFPGEAAGEGDAEATGRAAAGIGARAIVLDGYPFTGRFQGGVKAACGRTSAAAPILMVVDDNGECAPYAADVILNQNAHARGEWYRERPPGSRLLLGGRFVLLRSEFLEAEGRRAEPRGGPVRNVLVTLGGSDPGNVTLKAIRALQRIAFPGMRAKILAGALNPNLPSLEAAIAERPGAGIELQRDVRDMPGLMAWADLSLSAAGSTVWEMLYMGLPALVVATAENQRAIAESLQALGAAESLGWHGDLEVGSMARALAARVAAAGGAPPKAAAGRLVDGAGAARVAAVLCGEEPG